MIYRFFLNHEVLRWPWPCLRKIPSRPNGLADGSQAVGHVTELQTHGGWQISWDEDFHRMWTMYDLVRYVDIDDNILYIHVYVYVYSYMYMSYILLLLINNIVWRTMIDSGRWLYVIHYVQGMRTMIDGTRWRLEIVCSLVYTAH